MSTVSTREDIMNTISIVNIISTHLREITHDSNSAIFVIKGFLDEVTKEIKNINQNNFNTDEILDMLSTISHNIERLDSNFKTISKVAKEDLFEITQTKTQVQSCTQTDS